MRERADTAAMGSALAQPALDGLGLADLGAGVSRVAAADRFAVAGPDCDAVLFVHGRGRRCLRRFFDC